ncbi:MAG: hypothetical protein GY787_19600 [Alteromonadales bacterium]|nr:hypothetical protein [Alteromonadales bacterium]
MLERSRVVQLILMLFILLTLFFWKTFEPSKVISEVVDIPPAKVSSLRCNYVKACEFVTEQGTFYLNIKNLPIKPEEWINFELQSPIKYTQIKTANIVSKSMFMGKIPVSFKQSKEKLFIGKSLVGACITEQMIWELQISLESGELLTFDFMVEK